MRRESCDLTLGPSTTWMAGSDAIRGSRRRPSWVQWAPQHPLSGGGSTSRDRTWIVYVNNINRLDWMFDSSRIVARSTSDRFLTKGRKKLPPEPDGPSFPSGSDRGVRDGFHLPVPTPWLSLSYGARAPVGSDRPVVRPIIRSVRSAVRPGPASPPSVCLYLYICLLATCLRKYALI